MKHTVVRTDHEQHRGPKNWPTETKRKHQGRAMLQHTISKNSAAAGTAGPIERNQPNANTKSSTETGTTNTRDGTGKGRRRISSGCIRALVTYMLQVPPGYEEPKRVTNLPLNRVGHGHGQSRTRAALALRRRPSSSIDNTSMAQPSPH